MRELRHIVVGELAGQAIRSSVDNQPALHISHLHLNLTPLSRHLCQHFCLPHWYLHLQFALDCKGLTEQIAGPEDVDLATARRQSIQEHTARVVALGGN